MPASRATAKRRGPKSISPTQRSLAYARENGWPVAIVEHWNPHAFIRQDLWGIGDLLVLDDAPGVLMVQACVGASHATRATKVRHTLLGLTTGSESESALQAILRRSNALKKWISKGNRIEVWSWSKKGPRGKRKTWELRREEQAL